MPLFSLLECWVEGKRVNFRLRKIQERNGRINKIKHFTSGEEQEHTQRHVKRTEEKFYGPQCLLNFTLVGARKFVYWRTNRPAQEPLWTGAGRVVMGKPPSNGLNERYAEELWDSTSLAVWWYWTEIWFESRAFSTKLKLIFLFAFLNSNIQKPSNYWYFIHSRQLFETSNKKPITQKYIHAKKKNQKASNSISFFFTFPATIQPRANIGPLRFAAKFAAPSLAGSEIRSCNQFSIRPFRRRHSKPKMYTVPLHTHTITHENA